MVVAADRMVDDGWGYPPPIDILAAGRPPPIDVLAEGRDRVDSAGGHAVGESAEVAEEAHVRKNT